MYALVDDAQLQMGDNFHLLDAGPQPVVDPQLFSDLLHDAVRQAAAGPQRDGPRTSFVGTVL